MTDADITQIYSGPVQGGGDLPFFVGKQYGNGWLRTIGRFAFPILRRILNIAMNTGQDMVSGNKDFKQSLVDNAKQEVSGLFSGRGRPSRSNAVSRKRSSSFPSSSSINTARDELPGSIFAAKRVCKG